MKVSKNNDMLAATVALVLHGSATKRKETRRPSCLLEPIDGDFEVIENEDYLRLLRLYRGEVKAEDACDTRFR